MEVRDRKFRSWCFTLNNPTIEEVSNLIQWGEENTEDCYLVAQGEVGESGTQHLQGYVRFKNARYMGGVKSFIYRAHWEPMRGTESQAVDYCKKTLEPGEECDIEFGMPTKQGSRSDIIMAKSMIKEGKSMYQVWDAVNSYQAVRMAELGRKYMSANGLRNVMVYWYYGPTGSGKTYRAFTNYPDAWISSRNLKWWDGYQGQKVAIFDDFRADFCTFHELLRLLDVYPVRVETKGSTEALKVETIIITSCFHPAEVYKTREDIAQLLRRIDCIFLCENWAKDPVPVGWEPIKGVSGPSSVALGTEVGGNTNH